MAESYPDSGEASTPAPTPAYYAVIPADVRYHPDLPPNAKLLYGEITALCHKEGYCWASNRYFADLYAVQMRAVQRWLAALEAARFIRVEVIDLHRRRIWLPEAERRTRVKKDAGVRQKRQGGMSKMTYPPVKKDTPNNTESITKKNTKTPEGSPAASSEKTSDRSGPPTDGYAQFKQTSEAQEFAQWRQKRSRAKGDAPQAGSLPPTGEQ